MKQNKKIAVTGGIGSGKTLFCRILKDLGYDVFSCDEIYGKLIKEESFLKLLRARFPDCVSDGKLNKKRLAERIFANPKDKEALEAFAHPVIMQRLLAEMEGKEICFAEVPLLFEGGYENLFDFVIALVRSKEERIKAIIARSGLTEEEINRRMGNQFDPAHLSDKNCLVVENDGSEADLKQKAKEVIERISEPK